MFKYILKQKVDLALFVLAIVLLISYVSHHANYTSALVIYAGYVSFEIINKALLAKQAEELKRK